MLVDLQSPHLEDIQGISKYNPLKTISADEMTDMYSAWDSYVGDSFKKLLTYRKTTDSDPWLIDLFDIKHVKALITDIQEMTQHIPYKGQEIDMTKHVNMWFKVCPENHSLAKFFS